jgi:Asp-tRNA(Asn)/Glu-tRNA(Gln) amidotransferase C subunit
MVRAMDPDQSQAESDLDAATICRLARLAGLELEPMRAERLLADLAALIAADRRLAALDLGDCAATGDPWGRSSDDD